MGHQGPGDRHCAGDRFRRGHVRDVAEHAASRCSTRRRCTTSSTASPTSSPHVKRAPLSLARRIEVDPRRGAGPAAGRGRCHAGCAGHGRTGHRAADLDPGTPRRRWSTTCTCARAAGSSRIATAKCWSARRSPVSHQLEIGDSVTAVINGRRQKLTIVGVVLSPEYIIQIHGANLLPDDRRFGIFWMGYEQLASAFNMDGAFNDVAMTLMPRGARNAEVIQRLDDLTQALRRPRGQRPRGPRLAPLHLGRNPAAAQHGPDRADHLLLRGGVPAERRADAVDRRPAGADRGPEGVRLHASCRSACTTSSWCC